MKNYPGFYSPEYEEILEKSLTTSDREERFKYLKKAESILVEAMPLTAIYHWKNAYLIQVSESTAKGMKKNRLFIKFITRKL